MSNPFNPLLTNIEIAQCFPTITEFEIKNSGGEGVIVQAFDECISDFVAIKIYNSSHLKGRSDLEVQKLLKISNPHLIKLYNFGEIDIRGEKCFYTKTNWLNGKDLKSILTTNNTLSEPEVVKLIISISSAIKSLWAQHVVHCDIKPANIMLHNNSYFLIDLGMAKHLDADTLTAAGMIMGTLGYLAPEQFNGRKNLTFKADYYALGITVYELLVGYHPFNRDQRKMLAPSAKIQFPNNIQISSNVKELICKLTEPLPFNRPMNYNEIMKYIEI